MKRKLLSLALVLALCLGLAVPASAAQISDTAGVNLTAGERRIYNAMEKLVLDICAGRTTSTQFTVTFPEREFGWTAREAGYSSLSGEAASQLLNDRLFDSLYRVYVCMEYNHPYDLWFTWYNAWNCLDSQGWNDGTAAWFTSLTLTLGVSPDFQYGNEATVNPAAISWAAGARANAQAIVRQNAGKSNYEKLEAYRQAICGLTDYDRERNSVAGTNQEIYGRDRQAATVFDGDPNTKVVCEGYSKAFKYLCDLSDFDGDVCCYLVEGQIDMGALGSGPHMWNVVRMEDGRYYLTDITLYDDGSFGPKLPLLACSNEDPANYNYQQALYATADWNYGLFTGGYLPPLSATPYEPGHAVTPTTPTQPVTPADPATPENPADPATPVSPTDPAATVSFTDVAPGAYYADAVAWAVAGGVTTGTTATTFSPGVTCNRAQILTFLWRAQGSPEPAGGNPFADVRATDYYYKPALWAYEHGMVSGANFAATTPCTRASTVEYLWKAAGSPAASYTGSFTDVSAASRYAPAVAWAVANHVTTGTSDTTFSLASTCTRGQIVTFLYRAVGA